MVAEVEKQRGILRAFVHHDLAQRFRRIAWPSSQEVKEPRLRKLLNGSEHNRVVHSLWHHDLKRVALNIVAKLLRCGFWQVLHSGIQQKRTRCFCGLESVFRKSRERKNGRAKGGGGSISQPYVRLARSFTVPLLPLYEHNCGAMDGRMRLAKREESVA